VDDPHNGVQERLKTLEQRLQSESRLQELENALLRKPGAPARSGSKWPIGLLALSLVLITALLVALNDITFRSGQRITALESTTRTQTQGAVASSSAPSTSELAARLNTLENLQSSVIASAKSALEQMNFVFGVVAGFFGLFSLFLAYRQVTSDAGRAAHEDEVRSLIGSFRQNMSVINDLIVTLEKNYSYRQEVREQMAQLNIQIATVEQYKKKAERSFEDQVNALNEEALSLFRSPLDRQNFKSGDNRGHLEAFYVNMNTLERTGDTAGHLGPFTHFVRGLHFFNSAQYELAERDLEAARGRGVHELGNPTLRWYGKTTADAIKSDLKRMLEDCAYHLGIVNYNSGLSEKARRCFRDAFSYNPLDFRSRIYIPELLFFEMAPFDDVMREFAAVERELKAVSLQDRYRMTQNWEEAMASLKMREGNCYLPKLVPLPARAAFQQRENASLAAAAYKDAVKNAENIAYGRGRPPLTATFARFSLAQALERLERSDWDRWIPAQLFEQALREMMNEVVFKTEPVIIAQLNYSMSVCAARIRNPPQDPAALLSRAREHLQHVPDSIRIFSPINKILLRREELLSEMEFFQEGSRHATTSKAGA